MACRWDTRKDLAALGLLAVLAVGFIWPSTLGGRVLLPGDLLLVMEPWRHYSRQFPEFQRVHNPILDAVQQFYPWRKFAGEHLRQGQIPLWNPHSLSGTPFVGNNQSAVFYPETWLHVVMPTERALGWATAWSFFLAGALMYGFLRVLRLRRSAALVGAVAFMFNGFIIGWLTLPTIRTVPAWLPGILACYELGLRRRSAGWHALAMLCVGMQFLAGHLHASFLVLLVFAAYAGFRCVVAWRECGARDAGRGLAWAAGCVGVGGLLGCVQLLPVLELVGMSLRTEGMAYRDLLTNGLHPAALLTALMPDILGNPVDYNHWGAELGRTYKVYTESAWYVGLLPVLLAPAAFLDARREAWFWAAVGGGGLLLALGTHLNAAPYFLAPPYGTLAGINRAVLLGSVSLAVLGAYGMNALLGRAENAGEELRGHVGKVAATVGIAGVVGGLWAWMHTGALEQGLPGIGAYTLAQVGRFLVILAAAVTALMLLPWRKPVAAALVVAVLCADLYLFVGKYTPQINPAYLELRPPSIETIRAAPGHPRVLTLGPDAIRRMSPNTAMIVGLEDIQGSDSLEIGPYRRLLNAISTEDLGFPQPDPALPVVDLLGVGFVHSGVPLPSIDKLRLISNLDGHLYENTRALPRAFMVQEHEAVPAEVALQRVTGADFAPRHKAFISGEPAPSTTETPRPTVPVEVVRHEPNVVELRGEFTPGQLVVLGDAYYPGWRAFQDGRELPVMRANTVLRAVEPAAEGPAIRFIFAPGSFHVGGFLSLCAAGLISGLGAWGLVERRRRGGQAAPEH